MRTLSILFLCFSAVHAQSFEVATVKPTPPTSTRSSFSGLRNGTLTAERQPLRALLSAAYDKVPRLIFGPDWLDAADALAFDLTGKAPAGVPDTSLGPMLQALLKERFHLEAHLEMREVPVCEMVAAKDGVKLKPFDPANPPNPRNVGGSALVGVGSTAKLAGLLSYAAGRPVVDKIGLNERLTYVVNYMPVSTQPVEAAADPGIPDLFTAVQQQLGVKLEPKKAVVEVLVVDRADRAPTAN